MPINLGSAGFSLVINGTNFASGMAKMGGAVSSFAGHVTTGMAKSTQAYRTFSTESAKADDRITAQTAKIGKLKQELQAHQTTVQNSAQANATITSRITASSKAIEKQSEEIRRLTAFSKAWRTSRTADLVATGMKQKDASDQAGADFKAHMFQEKQRLVSMQSRLESYGKQNQAALLQHTMLENESKSRISQIKLEESALVQLQSHRAGMGGGPSQPTTLQEKGASVNAFASAQVARAKEFGDAVEGVNKRFERFTRGLRGATEAFGKQQEKVYAAKTAMESYQTRVEQAKAAVASYASRFEQAAQQEVKRRTQLSEAMALEERKVASILAEKAKLSAMAGKATQQEISEQMAKIAYEEKGLARARESTQQQRIRQKQDAAALDELKGKYATSQQFLKKLEDQRRSHNDKIKEEEEKLKRLVKEEKEAEKSAKALAKSHKESTQALDENGKKLGWFASLWQRLLSPIGGFKSNIATAKSGTDQFGNSINTLNPKLERLKMFLSTMAGSAIGSFFGTLSGQMMGASKSALEVYKSNELMQLSLQSMIAGQMVNYDNTISLTEAQERAIPAAQELDRWMKDLAIKSPFSQSSIKDGVQLGLSLGFNVDQMKRLSEATVDWAAASGKSGQEITQVIRAMGQMNANGKVTLEDLNQLTNVGIGWTSVLEKEFQPEIKASGKSLRDLISEGIVPADRAMLAITESFETSFAGGAEKAGSTVTGLLASLGDIKDEALRAAFTGLFEALKPLLEMFTNFFVNGDAIERIREFGTTIGENITGALQYLQSFLPGILSMWNDIGPAIMDGMSIFADLATEAYNWGAGLIQQYADGIWSYVSVIVDMVSEIGQMISYWMMPQSPPRFLPDIDKWGSETMALWRDGMTSTDMSSISEIGGQVRSLLSDAMGDDQQGLSGMVVGSEEAMAKAIGEFKKTGIVSESTFAQLRNAAGSAGQTIETYARSMFDAQAATKRVSDAQTNLNAVTKKYDDMLAPLNAKLDAARKKSEQIRLGKEIKSLEEMINFKNPAGMGFDMSEAQAKLEELRAEESIVGVEAEREKAITQAEKQVEIAEKDATQKQDAFDLIRQQIGFEQQRNSELRQQMEIMEEQIEKYSNLGETTALVKDETDKLAEAEFQTALMQADAAGKVQLLTDKLATLTPGTLEYEKAKQDLIKAEAAYTKELEGQEKQLDKLSDAEFNANLAGMTREEQIMAITSRMGEMTEGTLEYEQMRKKLNSLELAEEKADQKKLTGGGGAGKPKGGMLDDKAFEGLNSVSSTMKEMNDRIKDTGTNFKKVGDNAKTYSDAVRAFFGRLSEYGGMIGYIIQQMAASFGFLLLMNRVIKPIITFVMGLGRFLTPINLLALALVGLGIVIREDIGGIQGIIADAFADIIPLFERITGGINAIVNSFKSGDVKMVIDTLATNIPGIFGDIGAIAARIGQAVAEWVVPMANAIFPKIQEALTIVFGDVGTWLAEGGVQGLLENMAKALSGGKDGLGQLMVTSGLAALIGGIPLLITMATDQLKKNTPMVLEKLEEWKDQMVSWLLETWPGFAQMLGVTLAGLLGGALHGIMKSIPGITAWALEAFNVIMSAVPGLVKGFTAFLVAAATWLMTDGVVTLVRSLAQLAGVIMNWLNESGPTFWFQLTSILGTLATQIVAGIASIALYWYAQFTPITMEIGAWIVNDFVPGIVNTITSMIRSFMGAITGFIWGILEPVILAMRLFMSDLVQNGLESFGMAIDEGTTGAIESFVSLWTKIIDAVKEFLGIASPSTVFMQIGMDLIQGAIDGINELAESLLLTFIVMWNDVKRGVNNFVIDVKLAWKKFTDDFMLLVRTLRDRVVDALTDMVARGLTMFYNFRDNASTAIETWKSNIVSAIDGAKEALDGIVDKVRTALDDIKKFFTDESFRKSVMDAAGNIGKSMIDGIIAGIQGGFASLYNYLLTFLQTNLKETALGWIDDFFGSNPPKAPDAPAAPSGGGGSPSGGNVTTGMRASGGGLGFLSAGFDTNTTPWSNQQTPTAPAGANQWQVDQLVQEYLATGRIDRSRLAQFAIASQFVDRFGNFTGGIFSDMSGVFRYIQNLATERTLAMAGPSISGMQSSVSTTMNNSPVVNNFNATFNTSRSSNGLMNDFNVMKTLRRV